jgi:hypothetical protein
MESTPQDDLPETSTTAMPQAPSIASMRLKMTPATVLSSGRRESVSLSSLRLRAWVVSAFLLAYVPLVLLAGWAGVVWLRDDVPEFSAQERMLRMVLDLYGLVFVLTVIFFCLWVWRAAKTVRRLGITVSVESPGMAVWVFFIPIVWWWKPYAVVRTLWQVAMEPNDWDNVAITQALPLWWIAWIGQWLTAIAALSIELVVMGSDKRYLQIAAIWIFAICGAVAALCLFTIIAQTTHRLGKQLRNRQPAA